MQIQYLVHNTSLVGKYFTIVSYTTKFLHCSYLTVLTYNFNRHVLSNFINFGDLMDILAVVERFLAIFFVISCRLHFYFVVIKCLNLHPVFALCGAT